MFSEDNTLLFSGSSHPALAQEMADHLGLPLGKIALETFPDGETFVQILENVRGRDVFIVQSVARHPDKYLMELLIMVDAFIRASAGSVGVVIPYYGYCRQDRKDRSRVPITAKLVANLLETAGVSRVLTMDLHAAQVQGFFDVPVDNLFGYLKLVEALKKEDLGPTTVVAPDVGSTKIARPFVDHLGDSMAVVDKTRVNALEVEVSTVIGDVKDRDVVIVDDMCSTGGTLVSAAQVCRRAGAKRVLCAVTHGLMVGNALQQVEMSCIEKMIISNTVPGADELNHPKIEVVSVAETFGEAIRKIVSRGSISSLF